MGLLLVTVMVARARGLAMWDGLRMGVWRMLSGLSRLAPLLLAQTQPLDVRRGEQPGTVAFAVPGASLPMVPEGADWV